jgi:hypothetical protein
MPRIEGRHIGKIGGGDQEGILDTPRRGATRSGKRDILSILFEPKTRMSPVSLCGAPSQLKQSHPTDYQ